MYMYMHVRNICLFKEDLFSFLSLSLSLPLSLATKQLLEQKLAEAVQEEGDSCAGDGVRGGEGGEGEEVGSGSDSEAEGEVRRSVAPSVLLQSSNSLEMSLWSLDISVPSGMEMSVYETEVGIE